MHSFFSLKVVLLPSRETKYSKQPSIIMKPAIAARLSSLNLPTEVLVHIYCQLSSFSDVFHFSATSKQLNLIYCQKTNIIYNHVSQRCIQCQHHARQLLANQKGIQVDSTTPVTTSDVLQICQNARTVMQCLEKYNSDFIASYCAEDSTYFIPSIILLR